MSSADEKLELRYVPLVDAVLWDRNPKKHDYGAIMQSIKKYGFKDPPKFEPTLNDGKGGIVEGNGRLTVLRDMHMNSEKRPRGISENGGQAWLVPVLFGVDAASQAAAEAYAIDHNSLTMLGGDFGMYDVAKLYDEKSYSEILKNLQDIEMPPISMDNDGIATFLNIVNNNSNFNPTDEWKGMPEFDQKDKTAFQSIHIHFKSQKDVDNFSRLIKQKITEKTRSIWYPEIEIERYADKIYKNES